METIEHESWYLLHTKPRQENLALENLVRQGFTCYLPKIQLEKLRRHKLAHVEEPLFPRYLFIHLSDHESAPSWSPIRSTLGVSRLVKFGEQPAKVDDQIIKQLQQRENTQTPAPLYAPGDRVLITEGPLAGLEAIYHTQDAEQRSIILLDMLSRQVMVKVGRESLKKVGNLNA